MALHEHRSWLPVVGERVQIRLGDEIVREGLVDAVTSDDGVLWLAADGINTRTMFERDDGYRVWLNFRWESPSADVL